MRDRPDQNLESVSNISVAPQWAAAVRVVNLEDYWVIPKNVRFIWKTELSKIVTLEIVRLYRMRSTSLLIKDSGSRLAD